MRKRFRIPSIYKRGKWWCYKITNSLGVRVEYKYETKKDAENELLDSAKQVMSGISGATSYQVTFKQGIEFWRDRKKGTIVERSLERYDQVIENFYEFLRETYPLLKCFYEVQNDDSFASKYRSYRLKTKRRATKTVHDEEVILSDLFKTLISKKKIPNMNPFNDLDTLLITPVQERRVIPDEELEKFFNTAKQNSGVINWYGIFMTLYIPGMRRDEVRVMKEFWANLKTGYFEFPQTKTNKGKLISKTTPIHWTLRPIIEEQKKKIKPGGFLFPGRSGKELPKNSIRDKMIFICKKAGIPKATPHDLRHTWNTRSAMKGLSSTTRQSIGGWSTQEVMNNTYTTYPEKTIVNEYNSINILDFMQKEILTSR